MLPPNRHSKDFSLLRGVLLAPVPVKVITRSGVHTDNRLAARMDDCIRVDCPSGCHIWHALLLRGSRICIAAYVPTDCFAKPARLTITDHSTGVFDLSRVQGPNLLEPSQSMTLEPWQIVATLVFRQFALLNNAIRYSVNFKKHTIAARLTWSRDPTLLAKYKVISPNTRNGTLHTVMLHSLGSRYGWLIIKLV